MGGGDDGGGGVVVHNSNIEPPASGVYPFRELPHIPPEGWLEKLRIINPAKAQDWEENLDPLFYRGLFNDMIRNSETRRLLPDYMVRSLRNSKSPLGDNFPSPGDNDCGPTTYNFLRRVLSNNPDLPVEDLPSSGGLGIGIKTFHEALTKDPLLPINRRVLNLDLRGVKDYADAVDLIAANLHKKDIAAIFSEGHYFAVFKNEQNILYFIDPQQYGVYLYIDEIDFRLCGGYPTLWIWSVP